MPEDAPSDFVCELSHQLISDPVRSPYGHVFDAKLIHAWFKKNGSICPLTGQPLAASELVADRDLKHRITAWHVERNLRTIHHPAKSSSEDLYDFT